MILKTEIGTFELWSANSNDMSSDLVLGSESLVALEQVLTSLELAGVSEDTQRPKEYFAEISSSIKQRVLPGGNLGYVVVIDRASVCLWLNFEVLNYLGYGYREFDQGLGVTV